MFMLPSLFRLHLESLYRVFKMQQNKFSCVYLKRRICVATIRGTGSPEKEQKTQKENPDEKNKEVDKIHIILD